METLIIAQAISKQVRSPDGTPLYILSSVNLTVNSGEAIALLGASGSGKSTLLGLLAGLDRPSDGMVSLLGSSLNELDEDQRAALRRGRIGFVFQAFHLMSGMTALENVALPLQIDDRQDALTQANRLLDDVGLQQRKDHLPRQLSGGEQQRVALARAFAGAPKILFADEPTGNLDATTGEQIIDLMFQLRDQHNTALILVTHDPQLAQRCDRVLQLRDGSLVETTA